MTIIPFKKRSLYEPKVFAVYTEGGRYSASGTLCGFVDFTGPFSGTYVLSPDEVLALITVLQLARTDVLANSDPLNDPRIIEAL